MKKSTSFASVCMAVSLITSAFADITAFANTPDTRPSAIKSEDVGITPYYLYLQSLGLSVNPNSSKTNYTIIVYGSDELKSITGTAVLYKKNSSEEYEKKASKTHSLSGSTITKGFSFDSYGPGEYKLIFSGTAYSTSGGQEPFSISATNSY